MNQTQPFTLWVAYSGGLDSHVLLNLCAKLREQLPIQLRAIHVNHQLHRKANEWMSHCQTICQALNIELVTCMIDVNQLKGQSLEAIAREKRYAAMADYISENDVLLTAHHQDDQAETLLLQLARGAGIKGAAAMPYRKKFSRGLHYRPLLNVTRFALEMYAKEQALKWINDDTNQHNHFSRNFIRNTIMPSLKSRWPSITQTFMRSATHFAETQTLLDELVTDLYQSVQGSELNTLSVSKLLSLNVAKQKLLLRTWIEKLNYPLPNNKKLISILQTVLLAKGDKQPCVEWQNTEIRRYGDDLYLISARSPVTLDKVEWDLKTVLNLPHGKLSAHYQQEKGLRPSLQKVQVQFREGGESLQLNATTRTTLKHFFQQKRIPPWQRSLIPLIFFEKQLICIPDLFMDARFLASETEMGWVLKWCDSPA